MELFGAIPRIGSFRAQLRPAGRPGGDDQSSVIEKDGGALTTIREEFAPEEAPLIVERLAGNIDAIRRPVSETHWQTSHAGHPEVRVQIRKVLPTHGLPASGDLLDRAYAYIAKHH